MKMLAERMSDPQLLARGETRVYRGRDLTAINLPIGGIGAGCIQINGGAERKIWQIFNNFKGVFVPHSFFAVRAKAAGDRPIVRALQTSPVGPFKAMKNLNFRGEYPFGWYDFEDAELPVAVSMETFNPLIPLNARDSAIPCAIFNLTARNESDKTVEVSFLATQQNAVGFAGDGTIEGNRFDGYGRNSNRVLREKGKTVLHMTAERTSDSPVYGDLALAAFEDKVTATASWHAFDSLLKDVLEDGVLSGPETAGPSPAGQTLDGALAVPFTLEPGKSRTVTFVLTWHFPNGRHGSGKWGGEGNTYANWWDSAVGVMREVHQRFDELAELTRVYHDTFYASNLPHWLLDRLSSQVAVLRSKTCFWTRDGYFGGWEGCSPESGCCHGNCAHVWHYAQAHARLFPSIARQMREESLGYQTDDGKIPFRQPGGNVACDGQCGEILEAYREHLCSADSLWLDKHWPRIRKAMEYAIATWDHDEDGALSGPQHNTLDCEAGGSTSWLGSLYLAALGASEEMAELKGDSATAQRYRRIRKAGAVTQNATLWNGEYYIQVPDPQPYKDYNDGCHIDQVLGEWWANQIGLDRHYPADRVRSALYSLLKYNFQPNFRGIPQKPRKFVSDDDAGMQMITWPNGPRPSNHTTYADEAMTGFEYAASAAMVQYDMLKEGFMVTKAISDRYDGRLRTDLTATKWSSWGYSGNPFGDDECGKFYARAMSVWSVLLATQGFLYDGPAGMIGLKPVWRPEDHSTFFTAAEGWGSLKQKRRGNRQTNRIEIKWGKLRVKTLVFELPDAAKLTNAAVAVAGKAVDAEAKQDGKQVTISLRREAIATRGDAIEVRMSF
ncbi:glucosylceramidase [bacterium]|nr:glucosylceramidase [bacterium]